MGQLPFRENLAQFNNPEEVCRRLAEGKCRPPFDGIAQGYLASVDRAVSDKAEAALSRNTLRCLRATKARLGVAAMQRSAFEVGGHSTVLAKRRAAGIRLVCRLQCLAKNFRTRPSNSPCGTR